MYEITLISSTFDVTTIKFNVQMSCHSGCSVQSLSAHVETGQTINIHAMSKIFLKSDL